MRTARIIVMVFALATFATATKTRDWKTGALIQMTDAQVSLGTVANIYNGPLGTTGSESAQYALDVEYVIDGNGTRWFVQIRLPPATLLRHPKRPNVTIHAPVKYVNEKGKFFLQDEDGKEFELAIVRKEALIAPAP